MISLETPHHFIYSVSNELPILACKGRCKCVWFNDDFEAFTVLTPLLCPKCHSQLTEATGEHYRVLERVKSDGHNVVFSSHIVKPEFIAMFSRGAWLPVDADAGATSEAGGAGYGAAGNQAEAVILRIERALKN